MTKQVKIYSLLLILLIYYTSQVTIFINETSYFNHGKIHIIITYNNTPGTSKTHSPVPFFVHFKFNKILQWIHIKMHYENKYIHVTTSSRL